MSTSTKRLAIFTAVVVAGFTAGAVLAFRYHAIRHEARMADRFLDTITRHFKTP